MYLTYAYFYLEVPQSWEKSVFNLFPYLCFLFIVGPWPSVKMHWLLLIFFFFFFWGELSLCTSEPSGGSLHSSKRNPSKRTQAEFSSQLRSSLCPWETVLIISLRRKKKTGKKLLGVDKKNFKRTLVKSILEISFPDIIILKISQNTFTCR